eukprot:184867-Alexandrium_andersonii.AAC.1
MALAHLGYSSVVAAISAVPEWDQSRWDAVSRAVLRLRPGFVTNHARDWESGACMWKLVPLPLRVPPPWIVQG